jgi:hypothetical protein
MADLNRVNIRNREVRDELGSQPTTTEVYKTWTENVKVEEGPTVVKQQHIGHAFVVGHPVNGRIGSGYNGVDGEQIVIGSQALGDLTTVRVTNPNNRFIDRFWFDEFIDSNNSDIEHSTTNGEIEIYGNHYLTSELFYKDNTAKSTYTVYLEGTNTTGVNIYLSADNGDNWEQVTEDTETTLANSSTDGSKYQITSLMGGADLYYTLDNEDVIDKHHIDWFRYNASAYYPFEGNANDESENSNDGTVNGATLTTDHLGDSDNAYYFDGTDDYIEVPGLNGFNPSMFSYSFFYKPNSNTQIGHVISRYGGTGSRNILFYQEGSDLLFYTGDGEYIRYNDCLSTETWSHIVGVYDGTNALLYVDGNLVVGPTSKTLGTSTTSLFIMKRPDSSSYIGGVISSVLILPYTLTSSEVEQLYNVTSKKKLIDLKPTTNPLIDGSTKIQAAAYYPFNGNANDESVNSNDGTVTGATLTTDHLGNDNNAYNFDGDNDYIEIDKSCLQSTTFTISFWEYTTDGNQGYFLSDSSNVVNLFFRRDIDSKNVAGTVNDGPSFEFNLPNEIWNFHTITYDSDGVCDWYVNSELKESITSTGFTGLISNLYLGNRADLGRDFNGSISEVTILDKALNADEVNQLYLNSGGNDKYFTEAISYYPFDGNADDAKGLNDGTVNGATLTTDHLGNSDNAYEFDGTDDYIYSIMGNLPNAYTIAIYVKPSISNGISGFSDSVPTDGTHEKEFYTNSNGTVSFRAYDGSSKVVTSSTNICDGNWHHILVTAKDNDYCKLYINGVYESQVAVGTLYNSYSTGYFTLGIESETSNYLNGKISDVLIYSYDLSSSEVSELYNITSQRKLNDNITSHKLDKPLVTKTDNSSNSITGYELFGGGITDSSPGDSSYIDIGADIDVPKNNHSLYFEILTDNTANDDKAHIFNCNYGAGNGYITINYSSNTIHVESFTNNDWQPTFDTGIDIDDGDIHKFLFVFDSDETRLYVDGSLADTDTANSDSSVDYFRYRLIGGSGGNSQHYGEGYNGVISNPIIWERILRNEEITLLFSGTYPEHNYTKLSSVKIKY